MFILYCHLLSFSKVVEGVCAAGCSMLAHPTIFAHSFGASVTVAVLSVAPTPATLLLTLPPAAVLLLRCCCADIVFFGEPLPARFHRRRLADLAQADLLIVMGTSLVVQPFASMIGAGWENGVYCMVSYCMLACCTCR
jgi:hypothetical protein